MNKSDREWEKQLKKNHKKIPLGCKIHGGLCCQIREDEKGNRIYYCVKIKKDIGVEFGYDWEPKLVRSFYQDPYTAEAFCNWRPKSDEGKRAWLAAGFSKDLLYSTDMV